MRRTAATRGSITVGLFALPVYFGRILWMQRHHLEETGEGTAARADAGGSAAKPDFVRESLPFDRPLPDYAALQPQCVI